ncbi:putative bifunctional diguanylate cyclase/phosphodiesterase [Cellulomonas marina]|uniref:Diguanylate cyclase (GGDEF) domain-containing protein n=1 Tax=Cellulomonas marina TaxID=988821 RepID=A0A1I0W8E0_9CELL|nr:bifunctional diguanylate cyclase/phosphodiesterase [Cellulomonas marina]GIG29115.1 GGDEF domain-containing protein [Cellulomonas marina]SFA84824.1 diguanylate cyclase (GGDEF) domain-containing protein [Cellulomonas marina]
MHTLAVDQGWSAALGLVAAGVLLGVLPALLPRVLARRRARQAGDEVERTAGHEAARAALLQVQDADADAVVERATDLVRAALWRDDVEVRLHRPAEDRAEAHVAVAPGAPPLDVRGAAFVQEVGLVVDALVERAWLRERLDRTVRTDPLTGLANRMALDARLDPATDDALLLVDVDTFRAVNDVHGHATGDAVLRDVAGHLRRAAGGAFVARLGADQFVVLPGGDEAGHEAGHEAGREAGREAGQDIAHDTAHDTRRDHGVDAAGSLADLAERVAGELPGGTGVAVRLSAGLASRSAGERRPVPLLQRAEAALEEARATGAGWLAFDAAMEERRAGEHRRRAAMLAGVADQRFVAHLQPIVDVRTLAVAGVEALARWERGDEVLSPAAWLPLAEESGLIVPIGADMLRQAALVHDRHGLAVSVNVAPQQLTDPGFVATVEQSWGARPWSALTLEITEGALLVTEEVLPALVALRARGARISLDDFGTGFSSLARLVDLPVDELKIDRSFVQALGTGRGRAVLAAVVELARAHDLAVVAEGVETPDQLAALAGLGVDHVQGYLLGRPSPEPRARAVVELPEPHRRRWAAHVRAAASASAPTGARAAR